MERNCFRDILTYEAAALVGSLGMLLSASLSFSKGLYEPVHGSAPDMAGKNIANPIDTILSIALMFKYSFKNEEIHNSIYKTIQQGFLTFDPDKSHHLSTTEFTDKVIENLEIPKIYVT